MTARTVTVRGVELGAGRAKIAVPLVGRTRGELLSQAAAAAPLADLLEWRADFCGELDSEDALLETARALRAAVGELPVIFTIRTLHEGGAAGLTPERYAARNLALARSGLVDLIDVELSVERRWLCELLEGAHEAGVAVIGSRHETDTTPPAEYLLARLRAAQELGADISKLAVAARSRMDALRLAEAAVAFRERDADRPFAVISMGRYGMWTRAACALTGSCLTFGSVGEGSAPGQLPAEELRELLPRLDGLF